MATRPRGTRDFAPDEMASRRHAEAILRQVFARYAYREVQTPAFEELELFTAKSGDGIISELYNFKDKGDRDMTLRPELTAPVMRMYFGNHAFDPKPLKWFYHGACYRYDRPQEGRFREFWQFGCEQIGAGTPLAYAELIALGSSCFDALGLKEIEIRVGHVVLLRHCVDTFEFDPETRGAMMRAIDKGDRDEVRKLAAAKEGCEAALDRLELIMDAPTIAAAKHALGGDRPEEVAELEAVFDNLAALNVEVKLDLGIARGLDYYSGIVFEMHCQELEAQSQLLGGGGYDLSHVFGGQPTPTMGFGLGFDRALVALEKQGAPAPASAGPFVYLAGLSAPAQRHVTALAAKLRAAEVTVELDLIGRKPGAVAKHADAVGARNLVMLGDRDLESGQVRIKRLHDGQQTEVAVSELDAWLLAQHAALNSRHDD